MTGKQKGIQATGGDKGSKKTNDFETSGRDRNIDKVSQHPENFGREGVDDERTRPRKTAKGERGSRKPGTELTRDERANQAF